jgi:hypothetical protein
MPEPPERFRYMRADDFFRSARETRIVQEVRAEILRERGEKVLDEEQLRRQEDWSFLANRVVGAEGM